MTPDTDPARRDGSDGGDGDGDGDEFVPESLRGASSSTKLVWKKLNADGPVSAETLCDDLGLAERTWRRARKGIDAATVGGVRSVSDPDDGRRDLYWVGDRDGDGAAGVDHARDGGETARGERP